MGHGVFLFSCVLINTKKMDESTATATATVAAEDQDQCMVCLNACLPDSEHVWTCGCCQKRCHMLCIFQWTLRLSLNQTSRTVTTFTCPGCRADHPISGLPGFAQQRAPSRSLSANRPTNASTNVPRGRRRVVAIAVEDEVQTPMKDEESTEDSAEDSIEDEDEDDDDDDDFIVDDDDEDEDEDEDDFDDRFSTSVSTKYIYIEIAQLEINITR